MGILQGVKDWLDERKRYQTFFPRDIRSSLKDHGELFAEPGEKSYDRVLAYVPQVHYNASSILDLIQNPDKFRSFVSHHDSIKSAIVKLLRFYGADKSIFIDESINASQSAWDEKRKSMAIIRGLADEGLMERSPAQRVQEYYESTVQMYEAGGPQAAANFIHTRINGGRRAVSWCFLNKYKAIGESEQNTSKVRDDVRESIRRRHESIRSIFESEVPSGGIGIVDLGVGHSKRNPDQTWKMIELITTPLVTRGNFLEDYLSKVTHAKVVTLVPHETNRLTNNWGTLASFVTK